MKLTKVITIGAPHSILTPQLMIVDATQKKGKQFNPALISQERKPCIYCSLFTFPARAEIELENSARKKTETRRYVGS